MQRSRAPVVRATPPTAPPPALPVTSAPVAVCGYILTYTVGTTGPLGNISYPNQRSLHLHIKLTIEGRPRRLLQPYLNSSRHSECINKKKQNRTGRNLTTIVKVSSRCTTGLAFAIRTPYAYNLLVSS